MIETVIVSLVLVSCAIRFYRKSKHLQEDKDFFKSQYLRLRNYGIDGTQELVKQIPAYEKYLKEILKGDKEIQEYAKLLREKKNRTSDEKHE